MPFARITGTGFYVPPKIVKNDDLKAFYDTSDEWIYERSGIKERRFEGRHGSDRGSRQERNGALHGLVDERDEV